MPPSTYSIDEKTTLNQTTHIFKSKLPDIPINNTVPLHTYCFQKLPQISHRPCLITSSGKTYTYGDTHRASRNFAMGLFNLGIRKGDVIMILLPNSPEFVFSFWAASMLGAVSTPANPSYTSSEIMKQLKASKAIIVITHAMHVHKLKQEEENTFTVITVDNPPENCMSFSEISSMEGKLPEVDIAPDDMVTLPFSSGTTGLPKGVILTHRSLITNVAQVLDGKNPNLNMKEEDVVLCVLPLFHIYALHCVMLCSMRVGCTMLLKEKFEMRAMLELVEKHRVSVVMAVPPLVVALSKNPIAEEYDLSSIRMVMSGGAPLKANFEEAFHSRMPKAIFRQALGMTESGPVITMSLGFAKYPMTSKLESCGTVIRNAEMKIIDPLTGSSHSYNTLSEICIRGQQIMKGYLNDEKATAEAIDEEGWLHTGDIGYVDNDDEVFIVDRLKEIIKFKGYQVAPAELEGLLMSHPSIEDAAVVPQKDDVAGEVPVAFVVRSSNNGDFDLVTEDAVKDFIAKQVAFYKRPQRIIFIDKIPKSAIGKILRKELKAKLPIYQVNPV
ncbi:4-coumarate--CoA ligase 3, variant 2 [Stylosanthes scabra]|uniref:4-coumarate--CoA ligase 3, variant 2 n=1 Tax=Stylosanthes scabra TaxID=79078 RepID=A0ABU6YMM7_9FABA|nr:4-coumarate--CoA ligase 3, variant 2 [Stylosanthes scabra]